MQKNAHMVLSTLQEWKPEHERMQASLHLLSFKLKDTNALTLTCAVMCQIGAPGTAGMYMKNMAATHSK